MSQVEELQGVRPDGPKVFHRVFHRLPAFCGKLPPHSRRETPLPLREGGVSESWVTTARVNSGASRKIRASAREFGRMRRRPGSPKAFKTPSNSHENGSPVHEHPLSGVIPLSLDKNGSDLIFKRSFDRHREAAPIRALKNYCERQGARSLGARAQELRGYDGRAAYVYKEY